MLESCSEGRGKVDFSVFPVFSSLESSSQVFGWCPHSSLIFRNQCMFNSYPLLLHKKKPGIFWIFFVPYPPFWAFPSAIPSDISEISSTTTRLPEPVRINLFLQQTLLQPSSRSGFLVFVYKHHRSLQSWERRGRWGERKREHTRSHGNSSTA